MWLFFAFVSAFLLGFYDVFKKRALKNNAVIPVLFFNTLFSSIIFLPFILSSYNIAPFGTVFYAFPAMGWNAHKYIIIKAFIVLSSWIFGYFAIKNLPLTLVGPVNATRPVLVLVGAMILFGEQLNFYQWIGVSLTILSVFLLGRSSKQEGIDFRTNKWVVFLAISTILGAVSGLYDRYIMQRLNPIFVQSWFNVYQCLIMMVVLVALWMPQRHKTTPFHWHWALFLIPIFLSAADLFYYSSLADSNAMISIVSMVRRSSVIVSFAFGAFVLKENNLKSKIIDLVLIALGMLFIFVGR